MRSPSTCSGRSSTGAAACSTPAASCTGGPVRARTGHGSPTRGAAGTSRRWRRCVAAGGRGSPSTSCTARSWTACWPSAAWGSRRTTAAGSSTPGTGCRHGPTCASGWERLRSRFTVCALSNGNVSLLEDLASYNALGFDHILSAEHARTYKPLPAVYTTAASRLNLPPERILMVAAHDDDLRGARAVGFRTAFLPRPTEWGPNGSAEVPAEPHADRRRLHGARRRAGGIVRA